MAIEVRSANSIRTSNGEQKPLTAAFTDHDWNGLITLAREHGFDSNGEYGEVLHPGPGEIGELGLAATQELAVALSEALRKDTAPLGQEGSEDDTVYLGWVYEPGQGWERAAMIRVGPPDRPELQVGWVHARQLGELVESGPVNIYRASEPRESEEESV